nr:DUF4876 domain-containing protein [Muribaculaceae bacterium]
EINTGAVVTVNSLSNINLPAGTYNIDGNAKATTADGVEKQLRTVAKNVVITETSKTIKLEWFFYNADNSLVFSELYVSGTLNAKGTGGLQDVYFKIYNNTDEVIYADGLALCESQMLNTTTNQIITEANFPENNFTTQVVYVIPGNGTDVPVQPGQSIKIVDQAINWSAEMPEALDHTDADFEWYDEVTSNSVKDTDNPDVPNLDKWFSYSATIWRVSIQCNRSYALVRFPQGMTAEQYLADYAGNYDYIGVTGKQMTATKCYLIPNEWIIDGVNMCIASKFNQAALSSKVDMSYTSIADEDLVTLRCSHMFVRKQAGVSPAGNIILQDTNDSANDFLIAKANQAIN